MLHNIKLFPLIAIPDMLECCTMPKSLRCAACSCLSICVINYYKTILSSYPVSFGKVFIVTTFLYSHRVRSVKFELKHFSYVFWIICEYKTVSYFIISQYYFKLAGITSRHDIISCFICFGCQMHDSQLTKTSTVEP